MLENEFVFGVVQSVLEEIIKEGSWDNLSITPDTLLVDELNLNSIDYVRMADKFEQIFEEKINFSYWLSDLNASDLTSLKVKNIVNFIVTNFDFMKRGIR